MLNPLCKLYSWQTTTFLPHMLFPVPVGSQLMQWRWLPSNPLYIMDIVCSTKADVWSINFANTKKENKVAYIGNIYTRLEEGKPCFSKLLNYACPRLNTDRMPMKHSPGSKYNWHQFLLIRDGQEANTSKERMEWGKAAAAMFSEYAKKCHTSRDKFSLFTFPDMSSSKMKLRQTVITCIHFLA